MDTCSGASVRDPIATVRIRGIELQRLKVSDSLRELTALLHGAFSRLGHERQGIGLGSALLQLAENWARTRAYLELALDMAQPARWLLAYYMRNGYRFVESVRFPGKAYYSVVLSKTLGGDPGYSYQRAGCEATPCLAHRRHVPDTPPWTDRYQSSHFSP
jgi:hypothetical protein